MKHSKSSKRWLQEHFTDPYVKKAQIEGYRSRAVYKLQEIDERERLIKPGMVIIDLGAAPGGWSQYAARQIKQNGRVIALDILPMEPLAHVEMIQGDFTEEAVYDQLRALIPKEGVNLILSDMAPNMSGSAAVDIPKAMYLAELAFDFACHTLRHGGNMLLKVFHGEGFDALVKEIRLKFMKVSIRKPAASRSRSRETYLFAKGYNK